MGYSHHYKRLPFLWFKRERSTTQFFCGRIVGILLSLLLATQTLAEETTKKPFQLETFSHEKADFNETLPPLQATQPIDAESLFQKILACSPSSSKYDLSVRLEARYGVQDDNGAVSDISQMGRYYFGVVATLPLLDGSEETDRQRKREYDRRKDTSESIARFIKAIAKRNQIERQIGLFSALEQRAQVRVKMGVASVTEQVDYLKSVIDAQKERENAEAEILQNRLSLSGQCRTNQIEAMNTHLKDLAKTAGELRE